MLVKTIFVSVDGYAAITCEHCGKTKSVLAADVQVAFKPLQVQCSCKHTFFVCIEFRKFYRKQARLSGEYVRGNGPRATGSDKGNMFVENLSRRGLGFRTSVAPNLRVNKVIAVRFTLDDTPRTALRKSAVVIHTDESFVEAEFFDFDSYSPDNRTLGFYLMPR